MSIYSKEDIKTYLYNDFEYDFIIDDMNREVMVEIRRKIKQPNIYVWEE